MQDKDLVAILSGANINFDRLRHVAERTEIGENREALLAVQIPEKPGSFLRFCKLLGKRGITEFNYRYADEKEAQVFCGVELRDNETEKERLLATLKARGYAVVDMTDNETAKLHIRYMVGGHAPQAVNERVYRFVFPERPRGPAELFIRSVARLEHQPVSLPQPWRRLWTGAGGHPAGAERSARPSRPL